MHVHCILLLVYAFTLRSTPQLQPCNMLAACPESEMIMKILPCGTSGGLAAFSRVCAENARQVFNRAHRFCAVLPSLSYDVDRYYFFPKTYHKISVDKVQI